MSLLIHNVTIFTNDDTNRVLTDHAVAVDGATIVAVGHEGQLKAQYPRYKRLDGGGRLLMPGFVNAHMHFYGTFARGLALTTTQRNFGDILRNLWWRLDRVLDHDAVYYSTLQPALTGIRAGVTATIDHHASPHSAENSLDKIEDALALTGMRAILCYEVSDRDGKAIRDAGLAENERYIRKCHAARAADPTHLYDGMMGLHAAFTLDDDSLELAADRAHALDRGCHIHVLEDKMDDTLCYDRYGDGAVQRLTRFGVLDERSIAAHCIHLDRHEADLLVHSGANVTHQPQSNMNNAVGRADVFSLLDHGVTVGIGTDGMTPDVKVDVRTGYLLHKHALADCNAGWTEFMTMTLKNNPAIYTRLTGQKIGRIAPDYLADIILVDYFPPTPLSGDNIWGHFLFGIADAPVNTTIVNGRICMHDKQIDHIDEAEVAAKARESAAATWRKFHDS